MFKATKVVVDVLQNNIRERNANIEKERIYDVREKKNYRAENGNLIRVYPDSNIQFNTRGPIGKTKEQTIALDIITKAQKKQNFEEARKDYNDLCRELERLLDNNLLVQDDDCTISRLKQIEFSDESDGSRLLFRGIYRVRAIKSFERYRIPVEPSTDDTIGFSEDLTVKEV